MSYYLAIDDSQDAEQLASNAGYGDLQDWIETLDPETYGEIVHLAERGWCQNLDDLEEQLTAALEADGPHVADVRSTAENFLKLVQARPDDAVICYVTDGTGPDDGEDEEDEHGDEDDEDSETPAPKDEDTTSPKGLLARAAAAAAKRDNLGGERSPDSRAVASELGEVDEAGQAVAKSAEEADGLQRASASGEQQPSNVVAGAAAAAELLHGRAAAAKDHGPTIVATAHPHRQPDAARSDPETGRTNGTDHDQAAGVHDADNRLRGLHADAGNGEHGGKTLDGPDGDRVGVGSDLAAGQRDPGGNVQGAAAASSAATPLQRASVYDSALVAVRAQGGAEVPVRQPEPSDGCLLPALRPGVQGGEVKSRRTIQSDRIPLDHAQPLKSALLPHFQEQREACMKKVRNDPRGFLRIGAHGGIASGGGSGAAMDADNVAQKAKKKPAGADPYDLGDPSKIAEDLRPVVEVYMTNAAQNTAAKLGLATVPEIVNPEIPKAALKLALEFCEETNDSTTMRLDKALDALRAEMAEGLSEGEAYDQLAVRVGAVFDELETTRCEMIARTEGSRATHAGDMMTAAESGVVKTVEWLASGDACDKCEDFARKGPIPLGHKFGEDDYGVILHPPGHPNCMCSVTYGLKSADEIDEQAAADVA